MAVQSLTLLLNNAAMYSNLPLWEPYLQPGSHNFSNGANFASARARVLEETDPDTLYSQKQLSYFKEVANLLSNNSEMQRPKRYYPVQYICLALEALTTCLSSTILLILPNYNNGNM
ncbi:uncharacterized protein LOC116107103 isoform X2 [Pistacia vera]|uniref:uncharacterized protein LOC116107103 isoform X2 n=1 Tax=Pistacia vera TaxID=55513 RepID=UPI0012639C33|nr:uncharacterized protein LOC116107103 isoform X2 [Pistacia vera]